MSKKTVLASSITFAAFVTSALLWRRKRRHSTQDGAMTQVTASDATATNIPVADAAATGPHGDEPNI
jgi:hypothetical protein